MNRAASLAKSRSSLCDFHTTWPQTLTCSTSKAENSWPELQYARGNQWPQKLSTGTQKCDDDCSRSKERIAQRTAQKNSSKEQLRRLKKHCSSNQRPLPRKRGHFPTIPYSTKASPLIGIRMATPWPISSKMNAWLCY